MPAGHQTKPAHGKAIKQGKTHTVSLSLSDHCNQTPAYRPPPSFLFPNASNLALSVSDLCHLFLLHLILRRPHDVVFVRFKPLKLHKNLQLWVTPEPILPFHRRRPPSLLRPPEFHINCVDDSPELIINSLSYRVLALDSVAQTLNLARLDLWNETCTHELFNSSLASDFFSFRDDDNVDVTIFYGCANSSGIWPKPENWFHCNINQTFIDAYYLIGPVPLDPIMITFKCVIGITVPIFKITAAKLLLADRSMLYSDDHVPKFKE